MATTTTTVNKQTQIQNEEHQQLIGRYCKKPGHVNKECRKRIRMKQERQGEKQTTEKADANTTH